MLWMGFGTVVSKASSLLSFFVLGWFLSKEEFAIYALAVSSSIIFCSLRNGGLQQIILQRGERGYDLAIGLYFKYALIVNVIGMSLIFLISPVIVKLFENDIFYDVLAVIALSLVLGTSGSLYRLKLAIQLKFSKLAKFDMYSSFIRHGSAILFCLLGFGVFSFVLPLIMVAVFEHLYGNYITRVNLFTPKKINLYKFKKIFRSSKWMILSAIFISIGLQGDYFVVGLYESGYIVGIYFFGYQIIASVIAIASKGMQTVILPIITKFKNDSDRQAKAYIKMLMILTVSITLIAIHICLFAPQVINFLWNGKWDEAIPVVQIMSFSLVTWLLIPVSKSVLESMGRWNIVSYLLIIDALGVVLAAVVGSIIGGLVEITLFVSLFRLIYGFVCAIYVAKVLTINFTEVFRILITIMTSALIAMYCTWQILEYLELHSFIIVTLIKILLSTAIYLFLLYILQKSLLINTSHYFRSLLTNK